MCIYGRVSGREMFIAARNVMFMKHRDLRFVQQCSVFAFRDLTLPQIKFQGIAILTNAAALVRGPILLY